MPNINGYDYTDTANMVIPADGTINGYGFTGSENTGDPCMCPDDGREGVFTDGMD